MMKNDPVVKGFVRFARNKKNTVDGGENHAEHTVQDNENPKCRSDKVRRFFLFDKPQKAVEKHKNDNDKRQNFADGFNGFVFTVQQVVDAIHCHADADKRKIAPDKMYAGFLFAVALDTAFKGRNICKSYRQNEHRRDNIGYTEIRKDIEGVLLGSVMRKRCQFAEIFEMFGELEDNH